MWRTFYLLSLMLFTFDFPRDSLAKPERVQADLVKQDDDPNFRVEVRSQSDVGRENTGEVVGKWRNNGEALEPKWRDGDTVPLLPFSQYTRYTGDEIENSEEEDNYDHRGSNYPPKNGRQNSLRLRNNPRLSYKSYGDYESIESRRGYRDREREREDISPRKRNRPWISENAATIKETGSRKEQQSTEIKEDREIPAMRYREAFQVRPNEYEHEFSDDEYLKPRPRKRRPPQNYEFALAENETTYNNSGTWLRADDRQSASESTTKNAMELKSLLKMQQEEGLSLSEILQQRNLTLNDLLKGKADVINALKMKDVDKTEDYIVEVEVTTNSLAKVSASTTKKPELAVSEFIKLKDSQDKEFMISIGTMSPVLRNDPTRGSSVGTSQDEPRLETTNATIGKSILLSVDSYADPRSKVAVTTQMPLPIATNAMELLQANDATVKSRDGGEIKADNLDEDEIMEFSDFTDYKKGGNGMSPVWLMMKDGKPPLKDAKIRVEDGGSTLSIEKILSPTERSKPTNNLSNPENKRHSVERTKKVEDKDQMVNAKYSTEGDYNTSSEKDYQNDAPMYYDLEYSTQISSSTDENDMRKLIIQEIESALNAMSREENITVENSQPATKPLSVVNESDDNLKNHQNINTSEKKSYDEIISEVEPEARAEIFELFASGSAGKRLERLLKSRNMSLEELIALRQRGSSKVHLAEVSRIRTQKVTTVSPRAEVFGESRYIIKHEDNFNKGTGNDVSQSTENVNSDLTNPVRSAESTTEQYLPSLESIFSNDNTDHNIDSVTKKDENKTTEEGHRTVQIVDLLTTFGSMPFMKNIQKDRAGQYNSEDEKSLLQNSNIGVVLIDKEAETISINDSSNLMESGFVKEIVKEEPNSIDIQTLYSETNDILRENKEKNENGKIFSKVKPSIIASGAILGVTLVVFLGIFIICRIRQKQKYRYRNTFSRAVFQGPMLTARKLSNSSSLSTVMVNVVATSTAKRPDKTEAQETVKEIDSRADIDNDSLDANDSWETIPDYMK
ncbi:uncharacterized protein LOC108625637 [Ceratina calcarata]|uniref:Uncharacterized protein LOC108625637 n=1 Tax=Ceratina calcarata TaxID=156304 RepID=A0AAJ7J0Q8_9HYME|nr:uncharacterized protein LOC108625637 [Ceratina calcarata]